ncbi:hypothetical protein ACQ4LE_007763 [Meloidogyne hapla]|uniref:DUF148 domain-containing protein n=1 Tax=Meloidogyne hapla TaxID=6305 RepID=A0A1I8BW22_MELHA
MNLFMFLLTFFVINNVYFQLTSGMFKIPREGGYHQDESTDRKGKGIVQTQNQPIPNNKGVEFSLTELSILIRKLLKFEQEIEYKYPNFNLKQLLSYFLEANPRTLFQQSGPYSSMTDKLIYVINYYKTKFDEAEEICKIKKQEILKVLDRMLIENPVEFKELLIKHYILKKEYTSTDIDIIYKDAMRSVENMNAKQLDFTYVSMELNSFLNSDRNAYIVWNLILFTRMLIGAFIKNYEYWKASGQLQQFNITTILNETLIAEYHHANLILSGIPLKWGKIMDKSTYRDIIYVMFPSEFNIAIDVKNNYLINYIWLIDITDAINEYSLYAAQEVQLSHQGGHEAGNYGAVGGHGMNIGGHGHNPYGYGGQYHGYGGPQ